MKYALTFSGLLVISLLSGINTFSQQKNYLNPDYYGFENVGKTLWIAPDFNDYWSVSSEKAADGGTKSLKYRSSDSVSTKIKANLGFDIGAIALPAGDYTIKLKVWLSTDAEINGFVFTIKKPTWVNTSFNLSNIEKGKWVELSVEKTFIEITSSDCLITINPDHIGKGTMYIDDIQIWGENNDPVSLPYNSSITTHGISNISLPAGQYSVKLKVWKSIDAELKQFHTIIQKPWTHLLWDISSIATEEWIELDQTLHLDADVDSSEFTVNICNNPDFGGGLGTFYIDDITFNWVSGLNIDNTLFAKIDIYPNPVSDILHVKSDKPICYKVYSSHGRVIVQQKAIQNSFTIETHGYSKGIYLLQLISEGKSTVKPFIVQ